MEKPTSLDIGVELLKARKTDEAIQHFEEATNFHPGDYRGFNYLGIAYAQKGMYDRAVAAFLGALRLRSDIPSIHFNLGLAYKADCIMDKAREQFQRALELDPNYDKASEALKVLSEEEARNMSEQSCARHAGEPAVGVCSFCRLPVCQECKTTVDGSVYCKSCAPKA